MVESSYPIHNFSIYYCKSKSVSLDVVLKYCFILDGQRIVALLIRITLLLSILSSRKILYSKLIGVLANALEDFTDGSIQLIRVPVPKINALSVTYSQFD